MTIYDVKGVTSNDYMPEWEIGELFSVSCEAVRYRSLVSQLEYKTLR